MPKFESEFSRENYDKAEQEGVNLKAKIAEAKSADEIIARATELKEVEVSKNEMLGNAQEDANIEREERNRKAQIAEMIEKISEAATIGNSDEIIELAEKMKELKNLQMQADIEKIKKLQQFNQSFLYEKLEFQRKHYSKFDKNGEFRRHKENIEEAKQEACFKKPEMLDYEVLSKDVNKQKFGEYMLNPDTQNIDFEKAKVFIPDLSQFNGRKCYEVMKYIVEIYGITHHIPGIEYWKWAMENPDKVSQFLKKDKGQRLAGSLLRNCDGCWYVPVLSYYGQFLTGLEPLNGTWSPYAQIVLLEKQSEKK